MKGPQKSVLQPASLKDAGAVHTMIQGAIDESPFYSSDFKAFEKRRFSKPFLRALIDADPAYVLLVKSDSGETAGVMISGPDSGALFLFWAYLLPRHRIGTLAMRSMRDYVAYWNDGQFHKIVTMVRPDNRSPCLLVKRNGYREVALLEKHLFGEDYLLFERMLIKSQPGYGKLPVFGLKNRLRLMLMSQTHK
jgi:hypothetical protein